MSLIHKARLAAIISLVALLGAGCSLIGGSKSASIDAPPVSADEMMAGQQAKAVTAAVSKQTTLYFEDPQGFMAPISMPLPAADNAVAKRSLEYLVEDGASKSMLPQGFRAVLPKGTKVTSLNIKQDKTAVIDFSKEFTSYNPQDERKILEAITYTLTGFPTIDKVQIWVQGKALKEMPVAATPLDEPLTRALGLNIELGDGLKNVGQSMPVTVFFHHETLDHFSYYVPVTRMVEKSDNQAQAALAQLIKGPTAAKGLAPTVASATKVLELKQTDDKSLVTVNFDDKILNANKQVSEQAIQSVVLTLTENSGATKVQVMVKGDVKVTTTDGKVNSKPVSRPTEINPVKL